MILISCISSVYPLWVCVIFPTFKIPFNPNAQSSTLLTNSRLAKFLFIFKCFTCSKSLLIKVYLLIFVEVITEHFNRSSQNSSCIISTLKKEISSLILSLCNLSLILIYLTYVAPTSTTSVPEIICTCASLFPAGAAE